MMRKLSIILACIITFIASSIVSATLCFAQSDLQIGDYIELGQYRGQRLIWRYVGDDENGKLMFSRDNLCIKAFDAGGKDTDIEARKNFGSNLWSESTIRLWLNSNEETVRYIYGNVPDKKSVLHGYNPYDTEAGFLTNFTSQELDAIKEVTLKTPLDEVDEELADGEYSVIEFDAVDEANFNKTYATHKYENTTDKIFLIDNEQLDLVMTQLNDGYYKQSRTTFYEGDYSGRDMLSQRMYFLRTPQTLIDSDINLNVVVESYDGEADYSFIGVANGGACIRPAFYLADDVEFIIGDGTEENPYVVYNAELIPSTDPKGTLVVADRRGAIEVYVDNTMIEFPENKPFIDEAWRTQVPVRAISEALAFDVNYDEATKKIIITNDEKEIILTVGSYEMQCNDKIIEMDTATVIYNDSAYIPVRFVAEALGYEVAYQRVVTNYEMLDDGTVVPKYD